MALRIGIPRALHFYQHYPLWRTFLEELGAEVLVSPATNRDIVAAGAKVVADVTCLPIKVYAGHVAWLRDNGNVDFVFTPAIRNIVKDAFHCDKFQALPDIVKATVPDCPPLLDLEIDLERRKISEADAFHRLGYRFTWNPFKIRRAWANAREVERNYRASMVDEKLTYPEALARLYDPAGKAASPARTSTAALTIAVVGHPYCLYDDYISHQLISRLRGLGAHILTGEMVSADEAQAGIMRTTGQLRWFYDNTMSGAVGHYLDQPEVEGIISVLAFTCAPDSVMVETLTRRAHARGRSFMGLVLDEHGSATGMVTRLEAFIDMLGRQKQARVVGPPAPIEAGSTVPSPQPPAAAPAFLRQSNRPVIGFPRMGTVAVAVKSVFKGIGAQLELGPALSSRTVSLGARHSPEFICTPYKYILGNMIEMLDAGADTLLYVDGTSLCRNSAYTQLLGDVLRDLGYKFNFLSTEILDGKILGLVKFLRQFAPDLSWGEVVRQVRLGLTKMFVLDDIERRVQYFRPREITPGGVDKLWDEANLRIDDAADIEALARIKADVLQKIERTPVDPAIRPVRIATTGEIYAVLDPFFNLDLERELGKLGAEVHRTLMMSEWVKDFLFWESLGLPRLPKIDRVARPYLRWDISGEGWVTIGQTVIHGQKGFDGMVEALPFTCAPEVAALNILPRVSRDHNIPVLSFIFDEQSGRAGMKTRLEAFVDLLVRRRDVKESARQAVPVGELPQMPAEAACAACPIIESCQRPSTGTRPKGCALEPNRRYRE